MQGFPRQAHFKNAAFHSSLLYMNRKGRLSERMFI
jgi:hypothetical protein